jgi:hypothetical protein
LFHIPRPTGQIVPPEPAPPLMLAVLLQAPLTPLIGAVEVVQMLALLAACALLTSSALVSVEQESPLNSQIAGRNSL